MGETDNVRNIKLYKIYKGLVARYHSFLFILIIYIHIRTFIQYIRPSHSLTSSLFFFIAVRSVEGPRRWGAEPRIELGAAGQQPDAIPSELRRTLLSYAAPF